MSTVTITLTLAERRSAIYALYDKLDDLDQHKRDYDVGEFLAAVRRIKRAIRALEDPRK